MRATLPIWLFLSGIALASSFLMGLSIRQMIFAEEDAGIVFGTLGVSLSIAILSGYAIATLVFVCLRFYQNFYTDEGYLTFTLPVKRSTLYFSKVLSGVIFVSLSTLVILSSVALALLMVPSSATNSTPVLFEVLDFLKSAFQTLFVNAKDKITITIMAVLYLLILLSFMVFEVLALYLCITIGSVIAKKLKVLFAILCYYGANTAIGIVSTVAQFLLILFAVPIMTVLSALSEDAFSALVVMVLVCVLGFIITVTALVYYATEKLIEKKLNLP